MQHCPSGYGEVVENAPDFALVGYLVIEPWAFTQDRKGRRLGAAATDGHASKVIGLKAGQARQSRGQGPASRSRRQQSRHDPDCLPEIDSFHLCLLT